MVAKSGKVLEQPTALNIGAGLRTYAVYDPERIFYFPVRLSGLVSPIEPEYRGTKAAG
jgi:hypothetical protein